MGGEEPRFRVLHVSNISMTATKEQMYQLFAFIGRIDEFKVFRTLHLTYASVFRGFHLATANIFLLNCSTVLLHNTTNYWIN